jgi:hypothetical protein
VKFGPDRVDEFLKTNNVSMIIRAHECVMDGFERFAGGKLITLFRYYAFFLFLGTLLNNTLDSVTCNANSI